MNTDVITSRRNALVQQARAVRDGKAREQLFVEGLRLCEEFAASSLPVEVTLFTKDVEQTERGARLLSQMEEKGSRLQKLAPDVFDAIADTKTSQGVIALGGRPPTHRGDFTLLPGVPLIVVLHLVNNPTNAGAALRVAEAAGAKGVIATTGSTDLLSPKSLRGSMGSAFRVPMWTNASVSEIKEWFRNQQVTSVATAVGTGTPYTEVDWTIPRAVLIGGEAVGLVEDDLLTADDTVSIPMKTPVESLNLAVALGIILYEAVRQRSSA